MLFFRVNVYAFTALYLLFVKGQTNHIVTVALEGSFFGPPSTAAQVNDTITFQFVGDVHTVTQSTFQNPCSPLPGGFSSGPSGKGTNASAPIPTWNLVINDSAPIWFFCSITKPSSHCNQGMVGVINSPSPDMFAQYQAAARLDTGTPAPSALTVALTGQGAFATNSPTTPLIPVTPSSVSTTTTSSVPTSTSTSATSTTSPTQTAASSTNPHLGAIVGGSVAGGIALIGLFVILWLLCRRKRQVPKTQMPDDFFRYNPVPVRRPSEVFAEARRAEILTHNNSVTSNTMTNYSSGSRAPQFSPLRPQFGQSGPRILEPPNLHRQPSAQSDVLSSNLDPSTSGHTHSEQANKLDVRALAQEIAAVLYQGSPPNGHQKDSASQDLRGQMAIQNLNREDTHSVRTQPPPNYHAAMDPSPTHRGNVRHT